MNKLVLEQTIQNVPDGDLKYLREIVRTRFSTLINDVTNRLKEAGFSNHHGTGDAIETYQIYARDYVHMARSLSAIVNVKYGQIGMCALSYHDANALTLQFDVSFEDVLNAKEVFNSYLVKMDKIYTIIKLPKNGVYEHGKLIVVPKSGHFELQLKEPVNHTNTIQEFYYQCAYDKLEPISIQKAEPVRIHDDSTYSDDIQTPDAKIGILLNNNMKNKLILIDDRLHFKSGNKFSKLSFQASDSLSSRIKKKLRKL